MKDILRLVIVYLDQKREGEYEETLAVFVGNKSKTAFQKVDEWLLNKGTHDMLYLGANDKVYPRYKVVRDDII